MLEQAYLDNLSIPVGSEGRVWRYAFDGLGRRGHRHAELEINVVTHGTGEVVLRDRRYPLRRGTLVWLCPGQDHLLLQAPELRMWVLELSPEVIRRTLAGYKEEDSTLALQLAPDAGGRLSCVVDETALAALERLMIDVAAVAQWPALHSTGLAYIVLRAWDHIRSAPEDGGDHLHPAVELAMRYLRESISEEINLPTIAAYAEVSPSRLSRLISTQLGLSFVQLKARLRLQRALALLDEDEQPNLLDAAYAAGFGSYAQFFRVFRDEMGLPPREWLKARRHQSPSQ